MIKLRFPGGSILAGLPHSFMDTETEQRLLADNAARMRRLYPGTMYADLILLQREPATWSSGSSGRTRSAWMASFWRQNNYKLSPPVNGGCNKKKRTTKPPNLSH